MSQNKPSIVFAHGLWADGSCFSKLIPTLQAEGHQCIASQHPLNDVNDDVATVIKAIGRVNGPVILVGHSFGGTLITAAGIDDRVAGLVYISALAPDETETSQSQQDQFAGTEVFKQIEIADGRVWLRPEGIGYFCGDLSEEEQQLVWATAAPPAADIFEKKAHGTAWKSKPSLVHRGQQRPDGEPGTRAIRRQAHERHRDRPRQQPCPHALPAAARPRSDPGRVRGRRRTPNFRASHSRFGFSW